MKSFRRLFKPLKKKGVIDTRKTTVSSSRLVYTNAYQHICHDMYNNTVDVDIYHKVLCVKGAILKGNKKNDDPLKHSNAVILLNIVQNNYNDLLEIITLSSGLQFELKLIDDHEYVILVGGSIYDYKNLIKNMSNQANAVLRLIIGCLYELQSEYFCDLIQNDIMDADKFDQEPLVKPIMNSVAEEVDELYQNIQGIFTKKQILKFITISICHSNVSYNTISLITDNISSPYHVMDSKIAEFADIPFILLRGKRIKWAGAEWTDTNLGSFLTTVYDACQHECGNRNVSKIFLPLNAKAILNISYTLTDFVKFYDTFGDSIYKNQFNTRIHEIYGDIINITDKEEVLSPAYKVIDNYSDDIYDEIDEVIEVIKD